MFATGRQNHLERKSSFSSLRRFWGTTNPYITNKNNIKHKRSSRSFLNFCFKIIIKLKFSVPVSIMPRSFWKFFIDYY